MSHLFLSNAGTRCHTLFFSFTVLAFLSLLLLLTLIKKVCVGGGVPVGNCFDPLILPNAKFSSFYSFQYRQLLSSLHFYLWPSSCLLFSRDSEGGGGHGSTRGHMPPRLFVVQRCLGGGEESERKRRSRGTISPRRSHQQLWCGWKTAPGGFSSLADTVSLQLSLPIRRLALISHTPRHLAPSRQQGACDIKPNLFLTNL